MTSVERVTIELAPGQAVVNTSDHLIRVVVDDANGMTISRRHESGGWNISTPTPRPPVPRPAPQNVFINEATQMTSPVREER